MVKISRADRVKEKERKKERERKRKKKKERKKHPTCDKTEEAQLTDRIVSYAGTAL
jgi:hypothetical protein